MCLRAAFNGAFLVSSVLLGWWTDRSRDVRRIALVVNAFPIVGNLLYFVGFNVWVLLVGRIFSGRE